MTTDAASPAHPRLLVMSPSVDMYGSDRSLLPVLSQLAEGFDITMVTPRPGPLVDQAVAAGWECHVLPDWSLHRGMLNVRSLPGAIRRVRASLRQLRGMHAERPFAGVYANTTANAMLPFVRRAVPAPVVVHIRELPRDRPRLMKLLLSVVSRVADTVLCNSSFTAETAVAVVPRLGDRILVGLNGVPPPGRTPRPAPDDGVLDVVCVGRIHPKKGHGVLFEATRQALASGSRWRLHLHGDALPEHRWLADRLRHQAREGGFEGSVEWHGYSSDLDALYDGADVVVVPSVLTEEFSRVAAEAQMRGVPVVVTGPGGASEVVADGRTGRVVPPGDPAALAAAIRELEDPELRARWGAAGKERAEALLREDDYGRRVAGYVSAAVEKRPTVLVLSPSSDLYGSDRALLHALPGLLARHDVVVAVAVDGPLVREVRSMGASVVELPDFGARRRYLTPSALPAAVARNLRAIRQVRRCMRRRHADLLYVNTVAVPMLPALRLISRRPVLVHIHERARGHAWEQALITFGVRFAADLVVTNSEFTAATLDIEPTKLAIEVVHNGVEPAPAVAERDLTGPVRLICVARLHPKKGQWVLLDAVANLVAAGHDVAVDIVGDALPEHADLELRLHEQVARLGLDDRVVFHGYVSEVGPLYEQAHIVVVPSVDPEEFSLAAAEGQMRGLAAVVTGPGGVTEVVSDGETGFVVAPDDVDGLATALGKLLADADLRTRLGAAGRARMLERFTVDHYRTRLAAVVESLVARSGG